MKTRFWLFAAAALSFVACSQNDDIMEQPPVVTENDFESPDGRVVIQLGSGSSNISPDVSVTRGAYSDINDLIEDPSLGIFALAGTATTWGDNSNVLLKNINAKILAEQPTGEQSGVETDKGNLHRISLKRASGDEFGGVYYYPMTSDKNYSFYGYAPYQTNDKMDLNSSSHVIRFIDFEANQDILWAKKDAPIVENTINLKVPDKYKDELQFEGYNAKYLRILKYNQQNSGTYKPWVPNLEFQHKLALLKIYLKPADGQSEQDMQFVKVSQKVHSIKLLSQPKDLQLDLATGNVTEYGANKKDLTAYKYNNGINKRKFTDTPVGTALQNIGEEFPVAYFLVNPAENYELSLVLKTTSSIGVPSERTEKVKITRGSKGAFEAGKSYAIKLGIFAAQTIEATATLAPWGEDEIIDIPVE